MGTEFDSHLVELFLHDRSVSLEARHFRGARKPKTLITVSLGVLTFSGNMVEQV